MESEGDSDSSSVEEPIVLRRLKAKYTPKKQQIFDKIDEKFQETKPGRKISELQMRCRGPNDYTKCHNRYNSDFHGPADDEEDDSDDSFIVDGSDDDEPEGSGNEEESSKEDEDEDEEEGPSVARGCQKKRIREKVASDQEEEPSGREKAEDDGPIGHGQGYKRKAQTASSDDDDDDDGQAPMQGSRRKRAVIGSQSPSHSSQEDRSDSPAYPMLDLAAESTILRTPSDDEGPSGACNAPRKRRLTENQSPSAPRRSVRIAQTQETTAKAKRNLWGPYVLDVVQRRETAKSLEGKETTAMVSNDGSGEEGEGGDENEKEPPKEENADEDNGPQRGTQQLPPLVVPSQFGIGSTPSETAFRTIESLAALPDGIRINVRGRVESYGPYKTWFSSGRVLTKRCIFIQDESRSIVEVTLWGDFIDHAAVKEGAYIKMYNMTKKTYRDQAELATSFRSIIIDWPTPPEELRHLIVASCGRVYYVIHSISEESVVLYPACANRSCRYKKVDQTYLCPNCGETDDSENIAVGIRMVVLVSSCQNGSSQSQAETEPFTIFTPSVRKLWPDMPEKWVDIPHTGQVIQAVQSALPRAVYCLENLDDRILEIAAVVNQGGSEL